MEKCLPGGRYDRAKYSDGPFLDVWEANWPFTQFANEERKWARAGWNERSEFLWMLSVQALSEVLHSSSRQADFGLAHRPIFKLQTLFCFHMLYPSSVPGLKPGIISVSLRAAGTWWNENWWFRNWLRSGARGPKWGEAKRPWSCRLLSF